MIVSWKDLIVNLEHIDKKILIEEWTWLIGENANPIIVTSIGDLFFEDTSGRIYWLNVGDGTVHFVAESKSDLLNKMNDDQIANEWFMFNLVEEIKESGLELIDGKVYSYIKSPIIGGEYSARNFRLCGIEAHFSFTGQFYRQIKDLPDGTMVEITYKK